MYQIVQRLGLCPISQWGISQRSPDPLAGKGEGKKGKGRGGGGREEEGRRREGRGRRGRDGRGGCLLKFKSGYALGL